MIDCVAAGVHDAIMVQVGRRHSLAHALAFVFPRQIPEVGDLLVHFSSRAGFADTSSTRRVNSDRSTKGAMASGLTDLSRRATK